MKLRTLPLALVVLSLSALTACRSTPPAAPPPPPLPAPAAAAEPAAPPTPAPAAAAPGFQPRVEVAVTAEGFVPSRIPAKQGKPLTLAITRKTDQTCARDIVFKGQEGKTPLPLNKTVEVTYTPKASGEVKFGCAMGMMVGGVLSVE